MRPPRRVVITGLGLITPLGHGWRRAWSRLLQGESGVTNAPLDLYPQWESLPSRVAALVPNEEGFDKKDFLKSTDNARISLATKYGLMAVEQAIDDAQIQDHLPTLTERTGVSIGSGTVDLDYVGMNHGLVQESRSRRMSPYFVPRVLSNLTSGHVSIKYKLMGPNLCSSTACAAGSHALADAYRLIRDGSADVMVAGGVESCATPFIVAGFCRAKALSVAFNDDPRKASRPFDRNRDGFVIGEGAGIVIMESLDNALARSAPYIYAEMIGCGMSGDASHVTAARADGKGALAAMKAALNSSSKDDDDQLWCINAHATSTPLGDVAEMTAISSLMNITDANKPFVVSNKGAIGHLIGAAGSVESIFAILSLKNNQLPPNVNLDNVDEEILKCDNVRLVGLGSVHDPKKDERRRLVLKNSFGFGGTNVSLLFADYSEKGC